MLEQGGHSRAFLGVLLEALTDKVDRMGGSLSETLELEGRFFLKDRFLQICRILSLEGLCLAQKAVGNDSECPDVHFLVVPL